MDHHLQHGMLLKQHRNLLSKLGVTLTPVSNPDAAYLRCYPVSHQGFDNTLHEATLSCLIKAAPPGSSLHTSEHDVATRFTNRQLHKSSKDIRCIMSIRATIRILAS